MPVARRGAASDCEASNGDIRSFLQPASQHQRAASTPAPSTPAQSIRDPLLPSSPLSWPSESPRKEPLFRHASEIPASDSDLDSDSGHSLADLSALLRPQTSLTKSPETLNIRDRSFETPRAKRTAVEFHSPLAIHLSRKFDLAALAKDARQDEAITASSVRMRKAIQSLDEKGPTKADTFVQIVKENGGPNAHKVLRAVQRSEIDISKTQYRFFEFPERPPTPTSCPTYGCDSPWNLLTKGSCQAKEQHLASGVPQTLFRKLNNIPDSLVDWMLDEVCTQESAVIRQEYCNMLANGRVRGNCLLTQNRLERLFLRLGASRQRRDQAPDAPKSDGDQKSYLERDWSYLRPILSLFGLIAGQLSISSVTSVLQTLLCMSLDSFLISNSDVLMAYQSAVECLLEALPTSSWNSFCFEACSALHRESHAQSVRVNAILCLPIRHYRTRDLRRRLAVAFLLDDVALARRNARETVSLRGIINLLDSDGFDIRTNTDFIELNASILLLDVAIDDGSPGIFIEQEEEDSFNEEVDEVAERMRGIWTKINDSGMKVTRSEVKNVLEWVQMRLSHTVRTRRKIRKSVFDLSDRTEDPVLPLQQDFMKAFLQKAIDASLTRA